MLVSLRAPLVGLGSGDPNALVYGSGTSGPTGIEGVFEFNSLIMNERSWIDTYIVSDLLGSDDADVRDSRDLNPQAHGETPGNAYYGGRTLVLQGHIETKSLFKMQDMKFALRTAFADISVEKPLIFHGPDVVRTYYIMCKKSQKIDIPDKQDTANDFKRNFNITLRASLPWFLSSSQDYLSWLAGANVSVNAIVFQPVNNGNWPARPYLELTGPMTNPLISNESNGMVISFTGAIPTGETWAIDFTTYQPRVFRKSDGASRWSFVNDTSTDLEYVISPVANQVRFSATGMTSASKIESWHRHTIL